MSSRFYRLMISAGFSRPDLLRDVSGLDLLMIFRRSASYPVAWYPCLFAYAARLVCRVSSRTYIMPLCAVSASFDAFRLHCRRFICWQAQVALYGLFWHASGSPAASMGVSLPVVFRRFLGLVLALYAVVVDVRSWRRVALPTWYHFPGGNVSLPYCRFTVSAFHAMACRFRRWGWQFSQDAITVISIMTVAPSRK